MNAGPQPKRTKVSSEQIKTLESKIADLKARWPAHSVKPAMWQQLEELEEALEKAKRQEEDNGQ